MSYLPRSLSSFITAAYAETVDQTLGSASGSASTTVVPAGTIRVITNLCGWNNSGASGRSRVRANIGGGHVTLRFVAGEAQHVSVDVQTPIVLEAGDSVNYWVASATTGDVIYCDAVGYDIKSESA